MLHRMRLLLPLLFGLAVEAYAEADYRSAELKRLVAALHLHADSLHEGADTFYVNGSQVQVHSTGRCVTFVGYCLFPEAMKQANIAPVNVLSFLERYFLQLNYPRPERPRERMMREDRFRIEVGSLAALPTLRGDDAFSCSYDRNRYQATWSRAGRPLLSVSFPAEHELISGENKQESEQNIEGDMSRVQIVNEPAPSASALTPTLQKDYFVRPGGTYLNRLLTSDRYYQRNGSSEYVLIADANHPLETAANLMLSTAARGDYQLKVKQVIYGFRAKHFETPLRNWISYCRQHGCELYFGAESFSGEAIKGTVIAVNAAEGYNHLLFVDIPLAVISSGRGLIEARMHTFIPMHNVKELFGKYRKNRHMQPKIFER